MTGPHDAAPSWQPRDCHGHSTFSDGALTPSEVVARVYADVDRSLWPAAEQSVRSQLEYLEKV